MMQLLQSNPQYLSHCEQLLSLDAALILTLLVLSVFTLRSYDYCVPSDGKSAIFRHVVWGLSMTGVFATVLGLLLLRVSVC